MKTRLTAAVASGLVAAVLLVVQSLVLSRIVRDVLIHHQAIDAVLSAAGIAGALVLARSGLIALRELLARRAAVSVKAALREQFTAHLLQLGPGYVAGERTADLIAAGTDGIDKLDAYVSRYLPQTVLSVGVPLIIVLAILPVDPVSSGLLLFTVPVIVLLMVLIGTFTRDHVQAQWTALERLGGAFLDIVQGLPTLVLLDRDERERLRVERLSQQYRDRTMGVLRVAFVSGAVLELMTAAGIGLVATVLGVRLLDGSMPLDRAFFVFVLTPEFYRPLRELGAHRHARIEGEAAAGRILEIMDAPAMEANVGESSGYPEPLQTRALEIRLDGVTHQYPKRERPALEEVSLSFFPGTCTALVGRSGAGKTTVVNLLMRAMDPTEGGIRINGAPLRDIPLETWREQVALVPQRPYLFRGTLADNIRLARPCATGEEVRRAAELAGCLPFIATLPEGVDTWLGEQGEGLSAGQRQRLAIARAFVKDAPVLILDEPTSALDPESEAHIRQALDLLMHGRTVLVVAHRRNTVRAADRIAVLDNGRLAGVGTHEELLIRCPLYAALAGETPLEMAPV